MSVRGVMGALARPRVTFVQYGVRRLAHVHHMTFGRLGALFAVLVALAGVIIGGRVLAHADRIGSGDGRRRALGATFAGLMGTALGGFVVAVSDGSVGKGNGVGGAVVAMVLGVAATILGGLAVARVRRTR